MCVKCPIIAAREAKKSRLKKINGCFSGLLFLKQDENIYHENTKFKKHEILSYRLFRVFIFRAFVVFLFRLVTVSTSDEEIQIRSGDGFGPPLKKSLQ